MTERIHFVITGGTIDSYYEGSRDTVIPNAESVIPEFIQSLKPYPEFEFTTVCMKDSRELSQDDRKKVAKTVENSQAKKIIVTHGTYTMPDTARHLKANLKRNDQTIILTGSMIPIKGFSPSDGSFNLGFAISEVQHLGPGIYVAMNAQIFSPDEVTKLLNEGRFSSVFNS